MVRVERVEKVLSESCGLRFGSVTGADDCKGIGRAEAVDKEGTDGTPLEPTQGLKGSSFWAVY